MIASIYNADGELLLTHITASSSEFEIVTVIPHLLGWTSPKIGIEIIEQDVHYLLLGDARVDVFLAPLLTDEQD